MKSGIVVRAKDRHGNWDSVELTELDEIQFNSFVDSQAQAGNNGWNWVRQLAGIVKSMKEVPTKWEHLAIQHKKPHEKKDRWGSTKKAKK